MQLILILYCSIRKVIIHGPSTLRASPRCLNKRRSLISLSKRRSVVFTGSKSCPTVSTYQQATCRKANAWLNNAQNFQNESITSSCQICGGQVARKVSNQFHRSLAKDKPSAKIFNNISIVKASHSLHFSIRSTF